MVVEIDERAVSSMHVPGRSALLGINDPRWRTGSSALATGTIFHHPAWAGLLAGCYGYRPFALSLGGDDGSPEALLPIMEVAGLFRSKRWISLPFTDYCPPLVAGSTTGEELAAALLTAQAQQGATRCEVRAAVNHPAFLPRLAAVRHALDLTPTIGRIEAGYSKIHQRNIRKATRAGVVTRFDYSLPGMRHYYGLHVKTRQRQGVPAQSWRFFRLLWQRLIQPGLGTVLLAYSGANCVAGAVFLGWNGTLIYKYGASDLAFADCRPNNLLFGTAIRWARDEGYHTLDWGRTDLANAGLREFKSGWGAREEPLVYAQVGAGQTAGDHRSLRSSADRILGMVIRRSPPLVGGVIGTLLYRYAT